MLAPPPPPTCLAWDTFFLDSARLRSIDDLTACLKQGYPPKLWADLQNDKPFWRDLE